MFSTCKFILQPKLRETYESIKKELPWIERLDLVNDMAELAPELAVEVKF